MHVLHKLKFINFSCMKAFVPSFVSVFVYVSVYVRPRVRLHVRVRGLGGGRVGGGAGRAGRAARPAFPFVSRTKQGGAASDQGPCPTKLPDLRGKKSLASSVYLEPPPSSIVCLHVQFLVDPMSASECMSGFQGSSFIQSSEEGAYCR